MAAHAVASVLCFAMATFVGLNKVTNKIFPDMHALLAEQFAYFTPTTWSFLPVTPVQFMTLIGTTETALGITGLLVPPLRVTLAKLFATILVGAVSTHLHQQDNMWQPAAVCLALAAAVLVTAPDDV